MEHPTEIRVERYLDRPGLEPAVRDVRLSVNGSEVAASASQPVANGLLAMVPPVNAHDHGYGIRTLDFGCCDDALEPWIAGLRQRPETDPYLEALVAFGRLALNGCGATMHCHNSLRADRLADEVAAVSKAATDCGIRAAISCPLLDTGLWTYEGENALRDFVPMADWPTFIQRIKDHAPVHAQIDAITDIAQSKASELVDIQLGPIGPQWCSDALLEAIAEASEEFGLRIHMHLLESPRQRQWLDKRFPDGVVRHLDQIGFLSPRLAVAHGVQLKPDECALLAERGVIVVSNPSANLRLRSGIAPVATYRATGLDYAIGLDGTGFGDDQDIWQEIRLFWMLHGGQGLNPAIAQSELFEAVTHNGSTVLNQNIVGDLVTVDFGQVIADAMYDDVDEASVLLARMSGQFVRDLYVAGHKIVADGNTTNFDFGAARKALVDQARGSVIDGREGRRFSGQLSGAIHRYYRGWEDASPDG